MTIAICTCAAMAWAQQVVNSQNVTAVRAGDSIRIEADIMLESPRQKVATNGIYVFTPQLVAEGDSVELPSVLVLGRKAYYQYIRDFTLPYLGPADIAIRAKDLRRLTPYRYCRSVAYQPWMDRARLRIVSTQMDCCGDYWHESQAIAAQPDETYVEAKPLTETLKGVINGTAYIDFPLDSVKIFPDYHDNRRQLGKIKASIDSVQRDPMSVLDHMSIKGYASPEGPFKHNTDLARERTASLKRYILQHYNLPDSLIETSFEPEDWAGLRRYVDQATEAQLPHRQQLLAIIDDPTLDPDTKEKRMRSRYPADFAHLLKHSLPYLRHSDYRIDYTWRRYITKPGAVDTLYQWPSRPLVRFPDYVDYDPFRPFMALKTNLLFDLALGVNVEAEFPLGQQQKWSIMAEYWTPWYVWHHNSRAYELQVVGLELRRWSRNCLRCESTLTGTFYGVYAAVGKYDFEWGSNGDQGELLSFGASLGHCWPLAKRWNLELSGSLGTFFGPRRHYHGEYSDTHLIWKRNASTFYVGPTKLKLSLVWLLGPKVKKGGRP